MPKITKRVVESIKPAASDVFAWDNELRGFGVRVKPSGLRSYLVQYRNVHGRSKRMTIGEHGRLTAEEYASKLCWSSQKSGKEAIQRKRVMQRGRRRPSPNSPSVTSATTSQRRCGRRARPKSGACWPGCCCRHRASGN